MKARRISWLALPLLAACSTDEAPGEPPDVTCTVEDSFLCGRPRNIAHRGGGALAPENTLPAFENAVAVGADILEMDVRRTADDVLVLLHDPTVDRTTDGTGEVRSMSFAELRGLDAGHEFSADDDATFPFRGMGVLVPTLDEVLGTFPDRHFMIEIKDSRGTVPHVLARLEALGMSDRVVIASIFDDILAEVREQAPHVLTSMGSGEMLAFDNLTEEEEGSYVPPAPILQPPHDLLRPETLARAQHHRLIVQVWTVNDQSTMIDLLDRGVDGVITDDPALLRDILLAR